MTASLLGVGILVGCSASDDGAENVSPLLDEPAGEVEPTDAPAYVADVVAAVEAVEAELGGPQQYFEVTATPQLTNVFVAVDDATAAVAYLFVDGELQPPAPSREGTGNVFGLDDIDFDPDRVVGVAQAQLPSADIGALSVYGNGSGVTYVLMATSDVGGVLDIVVGADGAVLSVDPR